MRYLLALTLVLAGCGTGARVQNPDNPGGFFEGRFEITLRETLDYEDVYGYSVRNGSTNVILRGPMIAELVENETYYVEYGTGGNLTYWEPRASLDTRLVTPEETESISEVILLVSFSDKVNQITEEQARTFHAEDKRFLEDSFINYAEWNLDGVIPVTINMLSTEQCDRTNNDLTNEIRDRALTAAGLLEDDFDKFTLYLTPNASCALGQATTGRSRPRFAWLFNPDRRGTRKHEAGHNEGCRHPLGNDPVNMMWRASNTQKPFCATDKFDRGTIYQTVANPFNWDTGLLEPVNGEHGILPTTWHKNVDFQGNPASKMLVVHDPNKRPVGSIPARNYKDTSVHFSYDEPTELNVNIAQGVMVRRTKWRDYGGSGREVTYLTELMEGESFHGENYTVTVTSIDRVRLCAYLEVVFDEN
jgi:hypothetical protein